MDEVHHVLVALVVALVELHIMAVAPVTVMLVEDAQHLVKAIVDLTLEQGELHDDAVMHQTAYERVAHALFHFLAIIVACHVVHIHHGLLHLTHTVTKQIYRHHRQGMAAIASLLDDVLLRIILGGEILAEAKCLCVKPCLLQLDENQPHGAIVLPHAGGEVDAEHGYLIAGDVGMLVPTHLHAHHLLLEQGREHGSGDTFIFHQELEHTVINRIG